MRDEGAQLLGRTDCTPSLTSMSSYIERTSGSEAVSIDRMFEIPQDTMSNFELA